MDNLYSKLKISNKESRGITIVALVITIVILLILASISIQGITRTGIFSSAEDVRLEHKRASIASTLQTKLKINQSEQIRGTEEDVIRAAYEDVKNDFEEIKMAGGKNIEVSEVTSEEKDGKTEWFFEVKVDGDVYKVGLDGSDYLGKEEELVPLIQIKIVKATTNTIAVTVTTRRNEGGKIEYYIKKKGDSDYRLAKKTDQNEYTYTGLKQDTMFVIKAVAIAKNGKKNETREYEIETSIVPKVDSKDIEFASNPNTWTNGSVKVTATPKVSTQGFSIVTSKNPTSGWTKVNNQTFATNGTMYVALTDGNNYGVTASYEVTNIDKTASAINTALSGTGTTSTITLSMAVSDTQSGVNKIVWYYKLSTEFVYKNEVDSYPFFTVNSNKTHTFTKLIQGKTYNVYAEVYDLAGNKTTSTTINVNTEILWAPQIVNSSNSDWTKDDVTITLNSTNVNSEIEKYQVKYSGTNGLWNDLNGNKDYWSNEINETVYYRVVDKAGNVSAESSTTIKIDKTAPVLSDITNSTNENWTNDKVVLSWQIVEETSGIEKVEFSNDGKNWSGKLSNQEWYGLTRYNERNDKLYFRVTDKAGNISNVKGTSLKIDKTIPVLSDIVNSTNGNWTNDKVVLSWNIEENGSGIEKVEFSSNGTNWRKFK